MPDELNIDSKGAPDPFIEKAEEIFCAVMELDSVTERRALLENSCAGDDRLRIKVEQMLAVQAGVDRLFKPEPPTAIFSEEIIRTIVDHTELQPPDPAVFAGQPEIWIDRYKLLMLIGEGGGGQVYLAEQEVPLRRRVALKVIKLGMDTKNVVMRFEAERQALAMMDHPGIARVYDAGATASGRPYFVMELVGGLKITEYCDRHQLDVTERLRLFIKVCHAIQHAHQKGVIHRDIKPSNILISAQDDVPMPKVIDFGIAKAMQDPLSEKTSFTASFQLIGTPAYMSPEQAMMNEMDVDTRSDVYSLGVLLYELLTGKTPFNQNDLLKKGLDEMRRTLQEVEPHRPSAMLKIPGEAGLAQAAIDRRCDLPGLQLLLQGDLDWIVMKTLDKDRTRRYETVNGLAMDIERYLNHEPVVARPPSRSYRFQKLLRRNQAVFAAGSFVALALLVGLGVSTWMVFREKAARQEAEAVQANERLLRQQAEIREKITRATVLISHGNLADADALIADIPDSICPPYLEEVDVFRSLRDWEAIHQHWRESAGRAVTILRLDRVDMTDETGRVTYDYLAAAAVLLQIGNVEVYSNICQEALNRFAATTNPAAAEQLLKTSLLLPVGDKMLAQLNPFAAIVAKSFSPSFPINPNTVDAWNALALALNEYRRGHWDAATNWAQAALKPNDSLGRTATAQAILALAYHQTGQTAKSLEALNESRHLIETRFKHPLSAAGLDTWYSWILARILLNEAEKQTGG